MKLSNFLYLFAASAILVVGANAEEDVSYLLVCFLLHAVLHKIDKDTTFGTAPTV